MIYLVTGFQRSFTSMMMNALEAGGLSCVYDKDYDKRHEEYIKPDYHPNPDGYYEPSDQTKRVFELYPERFDGKAIKLIGNYGWLRLPEWDGAYSVVLMVRDPNEIATSYERFFGHKPVWEDPVSGEKIEFSPDFYQRLMFSLAAQLQNRKDVVSFVLLNGKNVIENPLSAFYYLKDNGWPIEPWWAASQVKPNLYRNRLPAQK